MRRRLRALRDEPTYPGVLAALLAEARAALPDAKVIRIDPADTPSLEAILDGVADGASPCLEIEPVLSTAKSAATSPSLVASTEPPCPGRSGPGRGRCRGASSGRMAP